ncbi:SYF2-domain-containing protein [Calocera viscosa TUFC12733]|uniref:Pre-mRNA-splicing factor SYF2 n=1 Tax=Calocera viscosa (strain TUFC12733) TaxID=1330018 RepID=A0A167L2Q4_CALVF|nr:SYF2-domain-containing protein [Calocera viscosa TUFC12733]
MPPRKRKSAAASTDAPAPKRATRSRKKAAAEPEPKAVEVAPHAQEEPPAQEESVPVEIEVGTSNAVSAEDAFDQTLSEPEPMQPVAVEDVVRDEEERDELAAMAPPDEPVREVAPQGDAAKDTSEVVEEIVAVEVDVAVDEAGDLVEVAVEETLAVEVPGEEDGDVEMEEVSAEGSSKSGTPMGMVERMKKLQELRGKMRDTLQANRKDLVAEHAKQKTSVRELQRLEKKRKLAEVLREKADAEERGEDAERRKNWEWSIEENEEWEKKLERKKKRADFTFNNSEDHARRRYKKDLDFIKPDLEAYNRQKEAALGLAPGTLVPGQSTSGALIATTSASGAMTVAQRQAAEDLYRDANSLVYADNKPTEDAIDRVVSKLNMDMDRRGKFSRKRLNEDDGDVTYINERNRVFNKKIARYYDKYTAEIRASFERGTAL